MGPVFGGGSVWGGGANSFYGVKQYSP